MFEPYTVHYPVDIVLVTSLTQSHLSFTVCEINTFLRVPSLTTYLVPLLNLISCQYTHNSHLVTQALIQSCCIWVQLFSPTGHTNTAHSKQKVWGLCGIVFVMPPVHPAPLLHMCHLTPSLIWQRNKSPAWEVMMVQFTQFHILGHILVDNDIHCFWKVAQRCKTRAQSLHPAIIEKDKKEKPDIYWDTGM